MTCERDLGYSNSSVIFLQRTLALLGFSLAHSWHNGGPLCCLWLDWKSHYAAVLRDGRRLYRTILFVNSIDQLARIYMCKGQWKVVRFLRIIGKKALVGTYPCCCVNTRSSCENMMNFTRFVVILVCPHYCYTTCLAGIYKFTIKIN